MGISEEMRRLLTGEVSFILKIRMPNWKKRNDHAGIRLSGQHGFHTPFYSAGCVFSRTRKETEF